MTRRGLDGSTPHTGSLVVLFMQLFFLLFLPGGGGFLQNIALGLLARLSGGGALLRPRCPCCSCTARSRGSAWPPTSAISNTHAIFGALWAFMFWENARPSSCGWGFSSWWPVFSGCRAEEVRSQGDGCCFCRFSRPLFSDSPTCSEKWGWGGWTRSFSGDSSNRFRRAPWGRCS